MARPSRCRRICLKPKYDHFAFCGFTENGQSFLTADEYETLRLIDFESRAHEQCAEQIGVVRTAVTKMHEKARFKFVDCTVGGESLRITGGNYQFCDGSARQCCGSKCKKIFCGRKSGCLFKRSELNENCSHL